MSQKIIDFFISSVNTLQGIRKTLVMVALITISVWFRLKGYMSGDNVTDLLKGTALGFFAANGIEHVGTTIKEYINSKGQKVEEETVDVSEAK